jgi:polyhydroxybutyrate depolymerase
MPLLIVLHGYAMSGEAIDAAFGFGAIVDQERFLYAYPDGAVDATGHRSWNVLPTGHGSPSAPDDLGYLTAIIDDISGRFAVDAQRVFLVGYSAGAFMAYRMACERSNRIAAVAGLGGAMWAEPEPCEASSHVSILHVHGDADTTVKFGGGTVLGARHFGAADSVAWWAQARGCNAATTERAIDLYDALPGPETRVSAYACPDGVGVELWTAGGAAHAPAVSSNWASNVHAWLMSHSKTPR